MTITYFNVFNFWFYFFWQLDVGQENKNPGEVAVSSLSLLSDTLSIMPLTIKKRKALRTKIEIKIYK